MKSKFFININVPQNFKKKLFLTIEKWQELPIKWRKEADIYITLVYLGFIDKEMIIEICKKVTMVCKEKNVFDIEFNQIKLSPSPFEPRIVALIGEPNEELKNLVNAIEKELGISNAPKKSFRPYITLGRIRKYKWESLKNKIIIQEKFPFFVTVANINVMSGKLNKDKKNHIILEVCPLK